MNKLYSLYEKNVIEGRPNDWNEADIGALTNFQINTLIAYIIHRGKKDIIVSYDIPTRDTVIAFQGEMSIAAYDFCSVANDAYPLILKEGIGIRKKVTNDNWDANISFVRDSDGYSYDKYATDKNPLRAAMIAYLIKFG